MSDLCKWERRKYHSELSICWVLNLREAPSPVVKSSMCGFSFLNGLYYILLSSVKMSCRTFVVTGAVPMQLPSGEWMRRQVKHSKFCYLAMSCLCWEKEHDPCCVHGSLYSHHVNPCFCIRWHADSPGSFSFRAKPRQS